MRGCHCHEQRPPVFHGLRNSPRKAVRNQLWFSFFGPPSCVGSFQPVNECLLDKSFKLINIRHYSLFLLRSLSRVSFFHESEKRKKNRVRQRKRTRISNERNEAEIALLAMPERRNSGSLNSVWPMLRDTESAAALITTLSFLP